MEFLIQQIDFYQSGQLVGHDYRMPTMRELKEVMKE